MIALVALVIVASVAALVAAPLLTARRESAPERTGRGELWRREKAVAMLAISEADFDLATGKLTDDDYRVLRDDYEGRAIRAMGELEAMGPGGAAHDASSPTRFCGSCGRSHAPSDRFCAGCGGPRL